MRRESKPHTIDEADVLAYLRQEHWDQWASSSRERKAMETLRHGMGWRVVVNGVETYKGQNVSDAVRAYNEATEAV